MTKNRQLILSSSSQARKSLLARLQIPFITVSPDVDETPLPDEKIDLMVLRLAELKAKKVAQDYPDALIIGCDQVGVVEDDLLTKPLFPENAVKQLRRISGAKVRFFTGICLLDTASHHSQLAVETYDVYFRQLSDNDINNYLQKEQALYCAGSFHAEGLGIALINKFAGNDYTALIGLPLIRLCDMLRNVGVDVLKM